MAENEAAPAPAVSPQRMVRSLQKHPQLAVELLQLLQVRVLSVWEENTKHKATQGAWFQRSNALRKNVGTVRREGTTWTWSLFACDEYDDELESSTNHPDPQSAMDACDIALSSEGYILLPKPTDES